MRPTPRRPRANRPAPHQPLTPITARRWFAPLTTFALTALLTATAVPAQDPPTTPTPVPTTPIADEPPAFEFRGGRWVPVAPQAPTTRPADEALDRAEDFLQRGGWRGAREIVLDWFDTHDKRDPNRDRATFLLAQAYFLKGHRVLAFYHFDEVLELYPESRLYPAALQRQYDIADAYLSGYKARFLYMHLLGMEDEAIEMLFRIQNRAPGSPIAEKALLRTADYYYATSQFDLAADAYGVYVKTFPRSPLVPRVRLRQAFSQMAQFRGTRFDATPALDARESLSDLIVTQPEMATAESLPAVVRRIDDALARKIFQQAEWYRRTDQPRGAAHMYRLMLKTYPEGPDAAEAQRRLDALPESAKVDPEPTTRPAGTDTEFVPPELPGATRPASTVPATPAR